MTLYQLECFITLAEFLNFTKAAERLFIAQSALSQQISRLEKKIGVPLFFRDKRSVRLTPAGEIFLKEALCIVNSYNEALRKTRETASGAAGYLRIGFLSACVKSFLPGLIRNLRKEFPNIAFRLEEYSHGALTDALRYDKIDLAFTLNIDINSIPGIRQKIIYTSPLAVVLQKEHPLAKLRGVDLKMLAEEDFIIIDHQESPQIYNWIIQLCARHDFSPRIISRARFIQTVPLLVESSLGISVLPRYFARDASAELCFVKIENDEPTVEVVLAWKASNRNPLVQFFLEALKFEELPQVS